MKRVQRVACCVLLACSLLTSISVLTACGRPGTAQSKGSAAEADKLYLGPFPVGTAVVFGKTKVALESVAVSSLEWPYEDTATVAPQGRKWVYVSFAFEGPDANLAPSASRFHPQFLLQLDGEFVPIQVSSSGGDIEAPPGVVPHEHFTFQVPEHARSAILQVTTKYADRQPVAFRLW